MILLNDLKRLNEPCVTVRQSILLSKKSNGELEPILLIKDFDESCLFVVFFIFVRVTKGSRMVIKIHNYIDKMYMCYVVGLREYNKICITDNLQ